jgi:tetratricopeptide (TPR) repeat protein
MTRMLVAVALVVVAGCSSGPPKEADHPKPKIEDGDGAAAPASLSAEAAAANKALEAGDYATARAKGQEALAKNPKDAYAHTAVGICDVDARKAEKDEAKAAELAKSATEHFRKALEVDVSIAAAAIELGKLLLEAKQFDEVVKITKATIAKSKGVPELYTNLGGALLELKDNDGALKAFRTAVKIDPKDALLHLQLGEVLLLTGDKPGALKTFKETVPLTPEDDDVVRRALALKMLELGEPATCVATLDPLIAKKPSPVVYFDRAKCKRKANDLAGARADASEVLKLKSDSSAGHELAATLAGEAGDVKMCKAEWAEVGKIAKSKKDATKEATAKAGADACGKK